MIPGKAGGRIAWKRYLQSVQRPASCSALMVGCKGTVHAWCCHWLVWGAVR